MRMAFGACIKKQDKDVNGKFKWTPPGCVPQCCHYVRQMVLRQENRRTTFIHKRSLIGQGSLSLVP